MTTKRFINLFGRVDVLRQCNDEISAIIKSRYEFKTLDRKNIVQTQINEKTMHNSKYLQSSNNATFLNTYPLYDIKSFHKFNMKLNRLDNGTHHLIYNVLIHEERIDNFIFKMFIKKYKFDDIYCLHDDYYIKVEKVKKMLNLHK